MKTQPDAMSRRGFLAQSIAATTSVSLGAHALAQPRRIGPNDKIRVGFIGKRANALLHYAYRQPWSL